MEYFKFILPFVLSLIPTINIQANPHVDSKMTKKPEIYAVVIGISDYKDEQIKDLQYADRDAQVFADYLQSENGGSVPEDHIKLLLGRDATIAAVYNALQWVKDNVAENDQFYFYFAGHGDVESSIFSLGFLLVYDTPYQNYLNNAIRLEDLNNITNTLSVNTAANSILITDACHSGKLAGNENKGKTLVGEQLAKVLNKEVRITSCKANELSQEGANWGDGRGVFSYYLIKGLNGEADDPTDPDGLITLRELTAYLDNKVSTDVFKKLNEDQNPVIDGDNKNKIISKVKNKPKNELLTVTATASSNDNLNSRDLSAFSSNSTQINEFYYKFNYQDLSSFLDFNKLLIEKKDNIGVEFLKLYLEKNLIDELEFNHVKALISNPKDLHYFNHKLAETLHNQVQNVINLYLEGDETELERRQYYNSKSNLYSKYPQMIQLAMNLLDKNEYLYRILEVKYHYFSGVVYRLKIPATKDYLPLIDSSLKEQLLAYSLEPKAAYINNELGILYLLKKDKTTAKSYFIKATKLSPSWSIPWANLSSLYYSDNDFESSLNAAKTAIKIQPNYKGAIDNLGLNYEKTGNLLYAEEQYRKSQNLNFKSFFSFERLAKIYVQTSDYDLADSLFYEAEKRKKGFNPLIVDNPLSDIASLDQILNSPPCTISDDYEKKKDVMACFYLAKTAFDKHRVQPDSLGLAKVYFLKLIKMDTKNPLAYRYLAEIDCLTGNYIEGELYIEKANIYYLNDEGFEQHFAELMSKKVERNVCVEDFYRKANFNGVEIDIIEGKIYENWGNYSEAETIYKKIAKDSSYAFKGNFLLTSMLFSLQRYDECEKTLSQLRTDDKDVVTKELYKFYLKMQDIFPKSIVYYQKAGNLLHTYSLDGTVKYLKDDIDPAAPEKPEKDFENFNFYQHVDNEYLIPGTIQYYEHAPRIYKPRKLGVSMFKKLIELTKDSLLKAEAYEKSGDLYLNAGGKIHAAECYEMGTTFQPTNSGIRWKLTDLTDELYQFQTGYTQLEYLFKHNQINYDRLEYLANYSSRYGDFNLSDSSIALMSKLPHDEDDEAEIIALNAQRNILSKRWNMAISDLEKLNKINPKFANLTYSLARINALNADYKQSYNWLKKSKEFGFNNQYVIQFDPAWTALKMNPSLSPNLNKLLKEIPGRNYPAF